MVDVVVVAVAVVLTLTHCHHPVRGHRTCLVLQSENTFTKKKCSASVIESAHRA